MSSDRKNAMWSKEGVVSFFDSLSSSPIAPETDRKTDFRKAVAVLASFDPGALRSVDRQRANARDLENLLPSCRMTTGKDGQVRWYLIPSVRSETLLLFRTRDELEKCLKANRRPRNNRFQQAIEDFILQRNIQLDNETDVETLETYAQVIPWFDGVPVEEPFDLPDVESVHRRLELIRFITPPTKNLGNHFRGRKEELEELRTYVTTGGDAPALLVWGIGGLGKTSLLTKFFLDNLNAPQDERYPWSYLDFDRAALSAAEPATVLREALRQIPMQYPEVSTECDFIGHMIDKRIGDFFSERDSRKERNISGSFLESTYGNDVFAKFREVILQISSASRPFLLIIDTFELVERRSREFTEAYWQFFLRLRSELQDSRVIVGSRTMAFGTRARNLNLKNLDRDAAIGCLFDLKVPKKMAAKIFEYVGGNPLNLRLAAELVRREKRKSGGNTSFDSGFEEKLGDELVAGHLFRRIINRIDNEDVRALAHPGLVLRRITPDIILKVLAKPCGLDVKNLAEARALLDELAQETALVEKSISSGEIVHRADVRREMYWLLKELDPDQVRKLNKRAVAYYKKKKGTAARVEELYHRLCLNQKRATLDKYWDEDAEEELRTVIDELPEEAQAYLASKSDHGLEAIASTKSDDTPLDWSNAELVEWERYTARRVADLLHHREFEQALAVLAERKRRSVDSPLFLAEARVLKWLGRWQDARQVLTRGARRSEHAKNLQGRMEIQLYLVRVCVHLKQKRAARNHLKIADELSVKVRLQPVHSLALALSRIETSTSSLARDKFRNEAAKLIRSMTTREMRSGGRLATKIASWFVDSDIEFVCEVLEKSRLPTASPESIRKMGTALHKWYQTAKRNDADLARQLQKLPGRQYETREHWISFVEKKISHKRNFWLKTILRLPDLPRDIQAVTATILKGVEEISELVESESYTESKSIQRSNEIEELQKALVSAFPSARSLDSFVRRELGVSVSNVTSKRRSVSHQVLELLEYADVNDRIDDLINALQEHAPENRNIAALIRTRQEKYVE